MENASKALIIAGAILLSILIIGLGVAVFNNANSTSGKADLSVQEIAAHNAQFEAYDGRIKGQQVRTLVNMIKKNNVDYEDRPIEVTGEVSFGGEGSEKDEKVDMSKIKNTTTYMVTFSTNGPDGLIDGCEIQVYGKPGSEDETSSTTK